MDWQCLEVKRKSTAKYALVCDVNFREFSIEVSRFTLDAGSGNVTSRASAVSTSPLIKAVMYAAIHLMAAFSKNDAAFEAHIHLNFYGKYCFCGESLPYSPQEVRR